MQYYLVFIRMTVQYVVIKHIEAGLAFVCALYTLGMHWCIHPTPSPPGCSYLQEVDVVLGLQDQSELCVAALQL